MMFYFLKHPDERKALLDELARAVPDGRLESLTLAQLNDMPRLNHFLKESLRLDPPSSNSVMYSAYERVTICGVDIPKGTKMNLSVRAANRNSEQWIRPTEFIPDRFNSDSPYFLTPNGGTRAPTSYFPFSLGPRNCVGQALTSRATRFVCVFCRDAIIRGG